MGLEVALPAVAFRARQRRRGAPCLQPALHGQAVDRGAHGWQTADHTRNVGLREPVAECEVAAQEVARALRGRGVGGDEQVRLVVGREERRADGGYAEGALYLARDDGDLRSLLRRDGNK